MTRSRIRRPQRKALGAETSPRTGASALAGFSSWGRRRRRRAHCGAACRRRATLWATSTLSTTLAVASLAEASATAPKPPAGLVRPGIYLSESVELQLQDNGTFELRELGGSRRAQGRYKIEPGRLVLDSGAGDVGRTRFPVTCQIAATFAGFAVRAGQPQCKPFAGLSFRSAN